MKKSQDLISRAHLGVRVRTSRHIDCAIHKMLYKAMLALATFRYGKFLRYKTRESMCLLFDHIRLTMRKESRGCNIVVKQTRLVVSLGSVSIGEL